MKSNFFKLCSMFLCGAMFAFAGCSDLEKDIQQVSKDVDAVEVSVTDLQAALDALEAAQEKMAQDYALKADLEKAQKELQSAFDSKTASLQALVDELNETVLSLDANKASKADVDAAVKAIEEKLAAAEADLKATLENINKALEGKANAEDLASAVADIDILKDGYSQMTAVLQNLTMALDGKASQEDVDSIVKDLATLKDFYQQTTEWIANTSTAIEALQNGQEDMAGEIEDLQTASAQLTLAATNLQGSIDGILGRVEVLEEQVEKINDEIDALKEQLKNDIQLLNEAFMEKDTELDQKIAINKQAIEDLTKAVSLLTYQVTNLANAFDFQIAEYDAKIETIVNTLEQLENVITSNNAAANQKIAWLQTQLDELKAENEKLVAALETLKDKTLGDLNTEIMNQISALEQADKDILANIESIEKALEGKIEAASIALTETIKNLNGLIGELETQIQSIAFVPEYDDLKATGYSYMLDGKSVGKTPVVTVKATYQVTPAYLASEIGADKSYIPYMLAKEVKPRTRASYDPAIATSVTVSNVNLDYGTFDVEAVFDAESVAENQALTLYLRENDANLLEDEAFEQETAEDILENAVVSVYTALHLEKVELTERYVLVDANDKEYKTVEDKVQWSDADPARTPLAGYTVKLDLDEKYMTLEEAAEFMHVDVASITPKYSDALTYTVKDAAEKAEDCKAQTVSDDEIVRTISINGQVTKETAKNFVGHKVAVEGGYYFGSKRNDSNTVIPVAYSYEIVNRQITVNLESINIPWSYALADKLSSAHTADKAYDLTLNSDSVEELAEVTMSTVGSEGYDIAAILNGTKGVDGVIYTIDGEPYDGKFKFFAAPVAHLDAQIAKVLFTGYAGMWDGKTRTVAKLYNIADDCTDIAVSCELTLGAIPAATSEDYYFTGDKALSLTSAGYVVKNVDFTADLAAGLTGFALGEFDDAIFNGGLLASSDKTVWSEGVNDVKTNRTPSNNTYMRVWAKDQQFIRISTNSDLNHADDVFVFDYELTPWYYAGLYEDKNTFGLHVEAAFKIPAYDLETESIWVDENNVVEVPGHTENGVWVVNDAKLHTYVNVTGVSEESADKLYVKWEVLTKANADKGYQNVPAPTVVYSEYSAADATIADSIIEWDEYTALDLDVKATLVMKKWVGGEVAEDNLIQVGQPIELTLRTNRMIDIENNPAYSIARNGQPAITASFAGGLAIYGSDTTEGSYDFVTVDGERERRNFIAEKWTEAPLYSTAVTKYGLDLTFDAKTLKVMVDGGYYNLSDVNYVLDSDFENTGKITFNSNDAVLNKDVTFEVDAHVTYNRDYNEKNQTVAPTVVKVYVTIKK